MQLEIATAIVALLFTLSWLSIAFQWFPGWEIWQLRIFAFFAPGYLILFWPAKAAS